MALKRINKVSDANNVHDSGNLPARHLPSSRRAQGVLAAAAVAAVSVVDPGGFVVPVRSQFSGFPFATLCCSGTRNAYGIPEIPSSDDSSLSLRTFFRTPYMFKIFYHDYYHLPSLDQPNNSLVNLDTPSDTVFDDIINLVGCLLVFIEFQFLHKENQNAFQIFVNDKIIINYLRFRLSIN